MLSEDEFKVWVPKGMTFKDQEVKIIAIPYMGKKILKVSTALHMQGQGCD